MNRLVRLAEMRVRISKRVKLTEEEFCKIKIMPKRERSPILRSKHKRVRPDFYHDMAVATRIKRQNGGCCR